MTEGSWHRNDTLWRTIIDINRCLFYADAEGIFSEKKRRRYLSIVDGIVAMEGNGPMDGAPKMAGCIIAAFNPVACDYVAASIMGFDPAKIPSIREGFRLRKFPLAEFDPQEIVVDSNDDRFKAIQQIYREKSLKFQPPCGWRGKIERS